MSHFRTEYRQALNNVIWAIVWLVVWVLFGTVLGFVLWHWVQDSLFWAILGIGTTISVVISGSVYIYVYRKLKRQGIAVPSPPWRDQDTANKVSDHFWEHP